MIHNTEERDLFDLSGVITRVYKWRKKFVIIFVVTLFASFLFSSPWFIAPKYKSTVIVFPTSNASVSHSLLGKSPIGKDDILAIGTEDEAEQMLQILNSDEIKNRIVSQFKLFKHYDIDSTSEHKNSKMTSQFEDNINFRRTEFLSIEISVYDENAQMAADMANKIADLVDSVKNGMLRQRAVEGFKLVEREFKSLESDIRLMTDSMTMIRDKQQAEVITEQLAIALSKNNKEAVKALQNKLDTLGKYGGAYVNLRDKIGSYTEKLGDLKVKYQEAKVDAENNLPQKFVVNKAVKADKKATPIRWLIILVSIFSTFTLAFLFLLINEKISDFKM